MATYYPNSSAEIDSVPTPYIHDQKFSSYAESPMIPGNLMMYLNDASSGSFSNCVEIPSMNGRNEMMFIPPTGDSIHMQAMTDTITQSVDGEQNLHGLSLSLSTQLSAAIQPPPFQHFSNTGLSKVDEAFQSKDLANSAYGMYDFHGDGQANIRFGAPNNLQYMVNPKGVGYNAYQYEQMCSAGNITKSKYLKAVQQLLDEFCNVRDALKQNESAKDQNMVKAEDKASDSKEKSVADLDVNESTSATAQEISATERQELQSKLDKLLTLLDEVDRRYKQYYHQMQILVSSFDLVAGNGSAKAYTTLAMKTISCHFRSLRDAISVQIQTTRKSLGEQDSGPGGVIPRLRHVDQQLRQQRALQQFGMMRHAWRPQRGLPENAVTTLRAWLFEHFLHPYPKDSEKIMLARQTGLTRGQVANWFINARVRLWKPMIEEMYKEEFSEADLNLKSSPENTPKAAAGEKSWASEDRDSIRSLADAAYPGSSHDESKTNVYHHTTEMNQSTGRPGMMVGPHGGDDKHRGLMRLHEDHGFYPHDQNSLMAFQVPELGSYGVDNNQVSLALGLSDETTLRPGESAGNAIGPGTTEYSYFGPGNQQHKFGNSHLLNDFVV